MYRNIYNIHIGEKDDYRCINYILAYLFVQTLNYFVKLVLIDFPYWSLLSKSVLALYMCNSLFVIIRKRLLLFLVVEITFLTNFAYTYLIGDYNSENFITIVFNVITVFIPLSFSVFCIDDFSKLIDRLYKISFPIIILLIYISIQQKSGLYDYNMALGYALLLQFMIVTDRYMNYKNWYDLFLGILIFSLIVGCGSFPFLKLGGC